MSRFASLSREELAVVVPELLLIGQLIDRSGMAWCISALGREEMAQIAIEEWMAASPIYTRRMQRALGFEGRPTWSRSSRGSSSTSGRRRSSWTSATASQDPWHGALPARPLRRADGRRADGTGLRALDVPRHRGPDLRRHRGRDQPAGAGAAGAPAAADAGRTGRPHCAWTVIIDDDHPPVELLAGVPRAAVAHRAAALDAGPDRPGLAGARRLLRAAGLRPRLRRVLALRAGPDRRRGLPADAPALPRLPPRPCSARLPAAEATEICVKQLIGIAGVAASRLHRALVPARVRSTAPRGSSGCIPLFNPVAYVATADSPAHLDGALDLAGRAGRGPPAPGDRAGGRPAPRRGGLRLARGPSTVVVATRRPTELDEVAVTRISTGAAFTFEPRRSLPITPV